MKTGYIITITKSNKVLAVCRSARSLADQMKYIGKSHVWYSRRLSKTDSFLFLFKNEVYNVQKFKDGI